ncbi:MAG: hypothetical protein IPL58_10085 [Betaproteobacteria bacterium]|uniref:Uncharacterized protein n=1 Tax=Candidatus Proximibacter danicus TaxID=2954365 RepID=A0A9D7PT23_9PROT|nr:hypothetical protein [Candidatus Proximibacter danicus]
MIDGMTRRPGVLPGVRHGDWQYLKLTKSMRVTTENPVSADRVFAQRANNPAKRSSIKDRPWARALDFIGTSANASTGTVPPRGVLCSFWGESPNVTAMVARHILEYHR